MLVAQSTLFCGVGGGFWVTISDESLMKSQQFSPKSINYEGAH